MTDKQYNEILQALTIAKYHAVNNGTGAAAFYIHEAMTRLRATRPTTGESYVYQDQTGLES